MNILLSLSESFESLFLGIVGFVVMMSIVVFVHEFGHFYIARLCGVKVMDFSIGFGKKLFSIKDKKETLWSLSLIPMGGYVKFYGDKSVASDEDVHIIENLTDIEKKQSFYFKSIPQKMAIIIAGPLANMILCFSILFFISFFNGTYNYKPIIHDFSADSVAKKNGLKEGDIIVKINGNDIKNAQEVRQEVTSSFGNAMDFTILRDNHLISFSFAPALVQQKDNKIPLIGVQFNASPENLIKSHYEFVNSYKYAYNQTMFIVKITINFFKELFLGKADSSNISGPIRLGEVAGDALKVSPPTFLLVMALVSMSIGLVNLLPVPMLDGGHLVFYFFELIGLQATPKIRENLFKLGFVLVVSVMVFSVINDIVIIGGR